MEQATSESEKQYDKLYNHKPVEEMTEAEREVWRNQVLRRTDETLKRSKQMLAQSEQRQKKYQEAVKAGEELERKWKYFQDSFQKVFTGFAEKFAESLGASPQFETECKYNSRTATPNEAADILAEVILNPPDEKVIKEQDEAEETKRNSKRGKLMILTGAGLSAPSGLPTFRGQGGLWSDDKESRAEYHEDEFNELNGNPMEIVTQRLLQENPKLNWNWHLKFFKDLTKCKPNIAHQAILKLQDQCQEHNIDVMLVTQNVDDYHCQLIKKSPKLSPKTEKPSEGSLNFAFTPHVVEIHGNFKYMRCNGDCPGFYLAPNHIKAFDTVEAIPHCPDCGKIMRHHCLFFDQSYDDRYYQRQKVEQFMKEAEAIIVIGTELETSLPNKIVQNLKFRSKLIVQINLKPKLNGKGRILNVAGGCEKTLPELINQFLKKISAKKIIPAQSKKTVKEAQQTKTTKGRKK